MRVVLQTGAVVSFYLLTDFEIEFGYNFVWLSHVLRPEKAIDRRINPTQTVLAEASREREGVGPVAPIPFGEPTAASLPIGPEQAKFQHGNTDFWAQGLKFTLNFRF